ncbi:hypothetical protein ABEB36_001003 [Hypothenemus hampei]|uniref:Origin recognition complex subunit 2 n=1 Tax=Hypothenemus hampei TaxID=57062 RepID=A0ABD1FFS3_HYPHA
MADSSTNSKPIRRTSRIPKPSLKAAESLYAANLQNSGFVAPVYTSSSDEEFMLYDSCESPEKPRHLHETDMVKGDKIFTFQRRKQKEGLAAKILEAQKTPFAVRNKMKSKIKEAFEDSGSEYEASEDDEDTSSETVSEEDEEVNVKNKIGQVTRNRRSVKPSGKYAIDSEEYFANSSGKIKTSNNTLDKLQTPRLAQYELKKLLTKRHSNQHASIIDKLSRDVEIQFNKWLYVLNQNFSILLYGLGSKENIISQFHEKYLQDELVVVVNGFFPSLSIKSILDNIIEDLLELKENSSNTTQAVELIIQDLKKTDTEFYLLINNIEAIKSAKAQSILADLAAVPNIHLVASIDHINAPLIWDHGKLSKFNFTWWDVTNYMTYQHETEYEMSSMTQHSSVLALSSLRNVFLSLTQNSKTIYLKVAKYQIEHSGQYYQGMAFKDLYMACRENFIVSSDLALRAQLSEFIDHKMIKTKRSMDDGTEYLIIPLANTLLQQFIEENSS